MLCIEHERISYRNYFQNVPRDKWKELASCKAAEVRKLLFIDAKAAVSMLEEVHLSESFRDLGFDSFQSFMEHRFSMTIERINLIKAGLGILGDGQHTAATAEAEGRKLASHGGDRRSQDAKAFQGSDVTTLKGRGRDYLLARLERDRPEVLAALRAGQHKSVHAAALAAGIVKAPVKLSAIDKARRALSALSEDERAALLAEFGAGA